MILRHSIAGVSCVFIVVGLSAAVYHLNRPQTSEHKVDFSRDIRPILNQSCVSCHGGVRQKNDVSFIYREEALGKGKSGRPTIVPGHPETSELIARVISTDPEARMPYHAPPLQPQQIALLKQWIKEGAQWEDHWAFVAPKPQSLPAIKAAAWIRRPLDRFILARLEREGLNPSPEADQAAMLRRVSFDLIGLPPTPEELSAFLADSSPDAYEKQVDRLLASPHYGERWAAHWLDLARYADSRGYEEDRTRQSWPYRDWVINAFNQNLPYDRFVITQLAGDLLPNATYEDRIATAFQRQTPTNDEGGTDDEEFRMAAVMDRTATTWSVLNGLTINCVQCHSHPYDPIRHVEYYKFLAFYNTSRDADLEEDSPNLPVPKDTSRRNEVAAVEQRREQLLQQIVGEGRSLNEQVPWTSLPITSGVINQRLGQERYLAHLKQEQRKLLTYPGFSFPPRAFPPKVLQKLYKDLITQSMVIFERTNQHPPPVSIEFNGGEARAVGNIPSQSVFELHTEGGSSVIRALRISVPPEDPEKALHDPEDGFIVNGVEGWIVSPDGQKKAIEFSYFVPDSEENMVNALRTDQGIRGGAFAAYSKLFRARWLIAIPEIPLTLASGSHLEVHLTQIEGFLDKPGAVKRVRLDTSCDPRWSALAASDAALAGELAELQRRLEDMSVVPSPVMAEEASYERRQTMEFERGNFLNKVGPALSPDVPGLFPKLPDHAPRNRLTMAQWFFAPEQPLTARVAVNRYWEQLFGTGIVETLEDFGSAGQPPSHPELLDWLALHFQNDLRWDTKALLRELVTSATYRQSSHVTPALREKDPHNRLLAHGPQQRLAAEMVRDQALLASGLLNPEMGGPPVMPPQPSGVLTPNLTVDHWVDAVGPERYRRAIYTRLKRSAIYPSFITFDASDHFVSLARRIPTNTPLQALVTLNDPVYHEAASALAQRMLKADPAILGPSSVGHFQTHADKLDAGLSYGARSVLSRDLTPAERAAFAAFYANARKNDSTLTVLTAAASVLLNLDAALMR